MECQSGGSLSRIERTTDVRVTNKILGECTICDFASLIQEPSIQNFGITYRKPLLGTSLLEGFWTHMAGFTSREEGFGYTPLFAWNGGVARLRYGIYQIIEILSCWLDLECEKRRRIRKSMAGNQRLGGIFRSGCCIEASMTGASRLKSAHTRPRRCNAYVPAFLCCRLCYHHTTFHEVCGV
jgi:hypothetical protein